MLVGVVALSLVVMAVIAAMAAQWSGKYGGRTQMSQAQASDQWSFYQAKSIKQHLTEAALTQLKRTANLDEPAVAAEKKKLEDQIARYDKEKAEIKSRAEIRAIHPGVADAILALREGTVTLHPGGGGKYGTFSLG